MLIIKSSDEFACLKFDPPITSSENIHIKLNRIHLDIAHPLAFGRVCLALIKVNEKEIHLDQTLHMYDYRVQTKIENIICVMDMNMDPIFDEELIIPEHEISSLTFRLSYENNRAMNDQVRKWVAIVNLHTD